MIRLLPALLLFFLPFITYGLILYARKQNPFLRQSWDNHPFVWLCVCGLIAVFIGGWMLVDDGRPENSVYVPAHYENGVFVPARTEKGPPPQPAPAPK